MATMPTTAGASKPASGFKELLRKLNSEWHERALLGFMVIVLGHWAEHLFQAFQIYALHWPRPKAGGLLGLFYPWLVKSEMLHYGYALIMLIGIYILRYGFTGRSASWWTACLLIQIWHHFEHGLLQMQALMGHNFFNSPVPVSVLQLVVPRVELHLFYNTLVFIPMVVAMYYHKFPTDEERAHSNCTCAFKPQPVPA